MWPFGKKQPIVQKAEVPDTLERRVRDLERAYEELAADLDWLSGDVKKLRGRVTGGIRKGETAQDAPEPTNGADPPPRFSPAWFEAQKQRYGIR